MYCINSSSLTPQSKIKIDRICYMSWNNPINNWFSLIHNLVLANGSCFNFFFSFLFSSLQVLEEQVSRIVAKISNIWTKNMDDTWRASLTHQFFVLKQVLYCYESFINMHNAEFAIFLHWKPVEQCQRTVSIADSKSLIILHVVFLSPPLALEPSTNSP